MYSHAASSTDSSLARMPPILLKAGIWMPYFSSSFLMLLISSSGEGQHYTLSFGFNNITTFKSSIRLRASVPHSEYVTDFSPHRPQHCSLQTSACLIKHNCFTGIEVANRNYIHFQCLSSHWIMVTSYHCWQLAIITAL